MSDRSRAGLQAGLVGAFCGWGCQVPAEQKSNPRAALSHEEAPAGMGRDRGFPLRLGRSRSMEDRPERRLAAAAVDRR